MKVQDLLSLKRYDVKIDDKKVTGYTYKNNKKFKFSVNKKLFYEALKIKNQQTIKNNENTKLKWANKVFTFNKAV